VNLVFAADGTYVARISLNVEVILAGIGPQHQDTSDSPNAQTYDALRLLPPRSPEGPNRGVPGHLPGAD